MKKFITIFLLISAIPMVTYAQWSNTPNQNTMIADTIGSQVVPIVVTNSLGETYISWYSEFDNLNYDVYLQKLDKDGVKLWDNEGLIISNHETNTWVTRYDMILDNEENVILVNQDIRTGTSNVFAYKISPAGEFLWGNDGIQLSNTTGFDPAPQVVVTDDNDLVFLWADEPVDTAVTSPLYVTKLSSDGNKLWETTIADTLDFMLPQMLYTENDEVIVSWMTKSNVPDTTLGQENWMHVFAQKLNLDGTPVWANNIQIDSGYYMRYLSLYTTPYLTSDGNGGAYVMWQSFFTVEVGGQSTTYVNRIYEDGTIWIPNGYSVSQFTGNSHAEAQMEYLDEVQKLMVCWREYHYDGVNLIDCWGVYGQLFSADGDQLWDENGHEIITLNCAMDTTYSGLLLDESINNNAILVYQKDYFSIAGTDSSFVTHMFGLSLDTDGDFVWSPPIVPLSLTSSDKYQSAIGNLVDNQWAIAWNDNIMNPHDLFEYGIYAQNISVNGKIGPLGVEDNFEVSNKYNFMNYPNPCSEFTSFTYTLSENALVTLDIYNTQGQKVSTSVLGMQAPGNQQIKLPTSHLKSGFYYYRFNIGSNVISDKLIVE